MGEGSSRPAVPGESDEAREQSELAYVVIERYNKNSELFSKLRAIRYRFMAQFGKDAAAPFDDFNRCVQKVISASSMLATYWPKRLRPGYNPESRHDRRVEESIERNESVLWEGFTNPDPIAPQIDAVLATLEAACRKAIDGK